MDWIQELKEGGYQRYRWFFTSSGKLVVGGKSAELNDELMVLFRQLMRDFIVMHTASPGSSFSIIVSDPKKVTRDDRKECAIFTGCFSKAWKHGKSKARVHIFTIFQTYKDKAMPQGTWGVEGDVEEVEVDLKLALTWQKKVLRAVPEESVKSKRDLILKITPGGKKKEKLLEKFQKILGEKYVQEEVLSALPAGGITLHRT